LFCNADIQPDLVKIYNGDLANLSQKAKNILLNMSYLLKTDQVTGETVYDEILYPIFFPQKFIDLLQQEYNQTVRVFYDAEWEIPKLELSTIKEKKYVEILPHERGDFIYDNHRGQIDLAWRNFEVYS
jgi:hypothetical protein